MVVRFIVIVFTLIFIQAAYAFKAYVNRSKVYLGESFVLTVESNDQTDSNVDISNAIKDFRLIGRSVSSSTSIINGKISSKNQFSFNLAPKREGRLQIAEIQSKVTGKKTKPIEIEVLLTANQGGSSANQNNQISKNSDFFFVVDALPASVYAGESFLYRVHFYIPSDRQTSITQEEIEVSDDFDVKFFERKKSDDIVQLKGRSYYHLVYDYFLTTKEIGELVLPRLQILGYYNQPFSSGFITGLSTRIPFAQYSPKHALKIKEIPSRQKVLPSQSMKMKEIWQASDRIQVGDSIQRQIIIKANDLLGIQIPEIKYHYPTDLKVYPESSVFDTQIDGKKLVGHRTQTDNIVPILPGKYVLGAIELSWWNTSSKRLEVEVIPTRVFIVESSSSSLAPLDHPKGLSFGEQGGDLEEQAGVSSQKKGSFISDWAGYVIFFFLVLCVFPIYFLLMKLKEIFFLKEKLGHLGQFRLLSKNIKHFLKRSDYLSFRNALVDWMALIVKEKNRPTLYEVSRLFGSEFDAFFNQLEQVLYQSKDSIDSDLKKEFVEVFKQVIRRYQFYYKKYQRADMYVKFDVRKIFED